MINNRLKIVTIGGGSSYTPELIEGFIARYHELPIGELWLVDQPIGAAKLQIIGDLAKRMVEKAKLDIKICTSVNRKEALSQADFVTTQIRVGGLNARINDERIPLKYDCIGQETTGPGGFANALRTIPVILAICEDMQSLCPDAWLINFTNPSGIVTEAVLKHTNIKTIGLCNCPVGMQNDLAEQFSCDPALVYCDFIGLNHLLWAKQIIIDGKDMTAKALDNAHLHNEIMKNIPDIAFGQQFLQSLGMLPISYLKYYYLTKEMLEECHYQAQHEGVRGEVVKATEGELFNLYQDPSLAIKPPQLAERGGAHYSDAACNLISAIYNDKNEIQVVNVLNMGATPDLDDDAVIERNCIIGRNGAQPLGIGSLPLAIRGLVQLVKAYEQLTIKAAYYGDRDSAIQALTIHPLVPSSSIANSLLAEILAVNSEYLPQFK